MKKIRDHKDIDEKTVTRTLEFKLTEPEFSQFGKDAAEFQRELNDLRVQFDCFKKEWKGKIDMHIGKLDKVLRIIRAGVENRSVECIERKNFKRHTVEYVYNGIVMHQRALELSERQLEMYQESTTPSESELSEKEDIAQVMREEKSRHKVAHVDR